jgi:E3 ubiquitin-protein ligase MYCBP2
MFYCSYYLCFKCKDPYFGGMKACNPEDEQKDFKPEELVCAKCSNVGMNAGVARC